MDPGELRRPGSATLREGSEASERNYNSFLSKCTQKDLYEVGPNHSSSIRWLNDRFICATISFIMYIVLPEASYLSYLKNVSNMGQYWNFSCMCAHSNKLTMWLANHGRKHLHQRRIATCIAWLIRLLCVSAKKKLFVNIDINPKKVTKLPFFGGNSCYV
mgnify:CR=1 FL=1